MKKSRSSKIPEETLVKLHTTPYTNRKEVHKSQNVDLKFRKFPPHPAAASVLWTFVSWICVNTTAPGDERTVVCVVAGKM